MTLEELRSLSDEEIREIAEEEWGCEGEVRDGYALFAADYMNGALHIERLDFLDVYENDRDAAMQAEKDGIKLIKDLPIDKDDYDYAYYIDTPENREIIRNHLKKRGIKY